MIAAIHQPNFFPWLGYFNKILQSDVFVFLDDVQFTKGSYINRVEIKSKTGTKWLTVPVNVSLGDAINKVYPCNDSWKRSHLDILKASYSKAKAFESVWQVIEEIYSSIPDTNIAEINITIINSLLKALGLSFDYHRSSDLNISAKSDDMLIEITNRVAPNGVYLSGSGARKYQDPVKFKAAGITLDYNCYEHPVYTQCSSCNELFLQGLSVIDLLFNVGLENTGNLLTGKGKNEQSIESIVP